MFNPNRLLFAIKRRGMSKKELAEKLNITVRTVSNYCAGNIPTTQEEKIISELSEILEFPTQFFYGNDIDDINENAVSFRARSRVSSKLTGLALSYANIAFLLNSWIESEFELIQPDLPDLSHLDPESAASHIRELWGLGSKPIGNLISILESKGIRVFSLDLKSEDIDAFCTWNNDSAFIFLNTQKSPERSRFDAAHELGHLLMDSASMKHPRRKSSQHEEDEDYIDHRSIERNADMFASAFLMPKEAIVQYRNISPSIENLLKIKIEFGVSLIALSTRMYKLNFISEWTYTRSLLPKISSLGFRTKEPHSIKRESSILWDKVFKILEADKITIQDVANELSLPLNDIKALIFRMLNKSMDSSNLLRLIK